MLGFIRRTISGSKLLLPTLISLYMTLVRSHLEYASEIWRPKSVTMIKRIEGVQRRATRLMLPDFSYNERLNVSTCYHWFTAEKSRTSQPFIN